MGNNFKILKADNVLPDPDSPTMATVLPFGISKLTSLTTFILSLKLIVKFSELNRGGHFAALEQPELFAEDVGSFFADLSG